MLESTGSHGRGVERRVPEMRRMVEFNCTQMTAVDKRSVNVRFKAVAVLAVSSTILLICQVVCCHNTNKL